uniref:Uncharacterized protein n=1 Tax=Sphaerodactylus townsendi TaxID=933632 RepID=A0ACB8FBS1_9SAUR
MKKESKDLESEVRVCQEKLLCYANVKTTEMKDSGSGQQEKTLSGKPEWSFLQLNILTFVQKAFFLKGSNEALCPEAAGPETGLTGTGGTEDTDRKQTFLDFSDTPNHVFQRESSSLRYLQASGTNSYCTKLKQKTQKVEVTRCKNKFHAKSRSERNLFYETLAILVSFAGHRDVLLLSSHFPQIHSLPATLAANFSARTYPENQT